MEFCVPESLEIAENFYQSKQGDSESVNHLLNSTQFTTLDTKDIKTAKKNAT